MHPNDRSSTPAAPAVKPTGGAHSVPRTGTESGDGVRTTSVPDRHADKPVISDGNRSGKPEDLAREGDEHKQ